LNLRIRKAALGNKIFLTRNCSQRIWGTTVKFSERIK